MLPCTLCPRYEVCFKKRAISLEAYSSPTNQRAPIYRISAPTALSDIFPFLFMNSFNKTEAELSQCRLCFLRLQECNGLTYVQLGRGFKNLLLFKFMPFKDDPPHRFSQFLLF